MEIRAMISMMGLSAGRPAANASTHPHEIGARRAGAAWDLPADRSRHEGPLVHIVETQEELPSLLAPMFDAVGWETRVYGDCEDFLRAPRADAPACLVLDAERDPAGPGLRAPMKTLIAAVPVIMIAAGADVAMAVAAMKAGAADVLEKPLRAEQVLAAVGAAIRQDRERRQSERLRSALRARFETLTPRERQVMAHVSAGKLNKQVAGLLGVTEITIKVHRGAVMRKMAARTLADLVRMADALAADDPHGVGAAAEE